MGNDVNFLLLNFCNEGFNKLDKLYQTQPEYIIEDYNSDLVNGDTEIESGNFSTALDLLDEICKWK